MFTLAHHTKVPQRWQCRLTRLAWSNCCLSILAIIVALSIIYISSGRGITGGTSIRSFSSHVYTDSKTSRFQVPVEPSSLGRTNTQDQAHRINKFPISPLEIAISPREGTISRDAVPFHILEHFVQKSLGRRQAPPPPLPPSFDLPPPTLNDADWEQAICVGAQMWDRMTRSEVASWTLQGMQSKFLETANTLLPQYGWSSYAQSPVDLLTDPPVFETITALGISTQEEEWIYRTWRHDTDYTDPSDGQHKTRSQGRYRALYNKNSQVIVTNHMFAPRKGPNGQPPQSLPSLRQWSDITFLQWYHNFIKVEDNTGSSTAPYPKLIIIPNIVNGRTVIVVDTAVSKIGKGELGRQRNWENRIEFDMAGNEAAYKALLSAPNVKAVGWLLITHKKQFGSKVRIEKIGAWKPIEKGDPFLAFWIGEG